MANFFDQFDQPSPAQPQASPYRDAIAGIESAGSGDYSALGPTTRKGDRAYGRYQVMGSNIGPWTEKYLGRRMSPEEFLASQEAQDRVFDGEFGSYVQKYGPAGAARAWFAGEGGMDKLNRKDSLGTSVAEYERKFAANAGEQPAQPQAVQASAGGANFFDRFDTVTADKPAPELQKQPQMTPDMQQSNVAAKGDRMTTLRAGAGMSDMASVAAANFVPSAKQFGTDILRLVTDLPGTATALKNVVVGGAEKLIPGEQPHEQYADAVGQFFADRYGGWDELKRTMAEDPVGFAADAATVLTGGSLALAKAPGLAGQIGRAAGRAASVIDPISGAVKGVKTVAKGGGKVAASLAGVTTGTGGDVVREAARAGFEGGGRGHAFRENMRGNVPMEDVISDAKAGLDAIRQKRRAAYKAGMADLAKDQAVLDFKKIDATLGGAEPVAQFKGISLNPSAQATVNELTQVLGQWRKLDPKEFHTPEGLDALKQRIGDIVSGTERGSPSEKAATRVYNVVRDQITKQAPAYAKTMKGYQQASDLIREIEKTLSVNPKANIDTTLRKLQSVMRNNVNTTYGRRADLVKLLEEKGATHLISKLAGQAANSWAPRGLARAVAGLQTVGGAGAALSTLNPAALGALVPTLAMQSPRLVNEAVHAGGRVAGAAQNIPMSKMLMGGYTTRDQPEATARPSLASQLLRQ